MRGTWLDASSNEMDIGNVARIQKSTFAGGAYGCRTALRATGPLLRTIMSRGSDDVVSPTGHPGTRAFEQRQIGR